MGASATSGSMRALPLPPCLHACTGGDVAAAAVRRLQAGTVPGILDIFHRSNDTLEKIQKVGR